MKRNEKKCEWKLFLVKKKERNKERHNDLRLKNSNVIFVFFFFSFGFSLGLSNINQFFFVVVFVIAVIAVISCKFLLIGKRKRIFFVCDYAVCGGMYTNTVTRESGLWFLYCFNSVAHS